MRVLFVPYHFGGLSHFLPLVSLARRLRAPSFESVFFLPPDLQPLAHALGVDFLPIENRGKLHLELKAYQSFAPDVVVDDCSMTTGYVATLKRGKRITIQRTGVFPFQAPRNPGHRHSLPLPEMPEVVELGLKQPRSYAELFDAPVKVVPGIRSIERLPEPLREDPSYVFSGPLIVDDYLADVSSPSGRPPVRQRDMRDFGSLDRFFEANRGRDVVYFTHGLVAQPEPQILECMRWLLDSGVAIVTSIDSRELIDRFPDSYYHARYLPLNSVCSRVKLAIHHCGSATYHYPLLHELPSITIGTQCHDREDVAVHLEALGASMHLPSPHERDGFVESFKEAVHSCLDGSGETYSRMKRRAGELKAEIGWTSAGFDFGSILTALAGS